MNAVNLQRLVSAVSAAFGALRPVLLALCLAFPTAGVSRQAGPQLAITLERVPDPPGSDTVTLKATLKNVSEHEVPIFVQGPLFDYSLTVTDSAGSPVPLSKRGKDFFSKDRVGIWEMAMMLTLQPGETRVDTFVIDEFFEFARPGRYLITVRRNSEAAHEIDTSNTLTVVLK
jgi:hypothetical protein